MLRLAAASILGATSTVTGLIAAFLAAAWVGGALPDGERRVLADGPRHEIVLLEGLLHTGILLPATPAAREAFAFTRGTSFPIDAPSLRWIGIGWGSAAFYTTAGSYADIEFGTAWRAATGDSAVIRLVGYGELIDGPELRRLQTDDAGLRALLAHALGSFDRSANGDALLVKGASLTPGDVFYEAVGRFHLFHPCNEWARQGLRRAGFGVGRWTPTTFALAGSIERFD